ncbi:MAG: enoyl-CoA hydratase [Actinomycetia bacterium]|nr:enoyl-CoA hydratase [Actinomycetes bacterium]
MTTTETSRNEPLLIERAGPISILTFNRPDRRNALNSAMRRGLSDAMAEASDDDEVRVIVLTGADPAFCAGLDLVELGSGRNEAERASNVGRGSIRPWRPMTKPIIGAINGPAVTGGFELALNCDFLIASDRASFADTHARVGVMPGWGLTPLLADAVGARRARQISLSGNYVDAGKALTWGLVNEVVPHESLMDVVMELAIDIAENDQAGVRRMLATYSEQEDARLSQAWTIEGRAAVDFREANLYDASTVERRRQAIIDRGRSQVT